MTDFTTTNEQKLSTKSEVLKVIKSFRGTIFVRGACYLASADNDERGYNDMSCFVPVTRKSATKYVNDILSKGLEDKGARMPITIGKGYAPCLFIGH